MSVKIINDSMRVKQNCSPDNLFYANPRFAYHLDEGFRKRLTRLYELHISPDNIVLDLMSSWTSHLPKNIKYKKVIGHGMNEKELQANYRLDEYWIQDLNKDQKIPHENSSIDTVLITAGWQYLQQSESVAAELHRITKNRGKIIVSFSNRAFWEKAPRIWAEGSDEEHIKYISNVLKAQGWSNITIQSEINIEKTFLGLITGNSDPFFSVIANH